MYFLNHILYSTILLLYIYYIKYAFHLHGVGLFKNQKEAIPTGHIILLILNSFQHYIKQMGKFCITNAEISLNVCGAQPISST